MPVAGGGGEQAMTVLRARVTAGNAPTAVQMLGFDIQDWGEQGVVADLNATAAAEGWDGVVQEALQRFSKYDDKWIAAPVNVHSTNRVWANKKIFDELEIAQPTTWDELVAALTKIKDAGYTAVAHGGQAWQDATIFDAECLIDVVEPAGSDTFAVTELGGREVIARMRSDADVRAGAPTALAFNMDKAVFFDPSSEQRLS